MSGENAPDAAFWTICKIGLEQVENTFSPGGIETYNSA